jgi:hypothetical protein
VLKGELVEPKVNLPWVHFFAARWYPGSWRGSQELVKGAGL